MGTPPLPVGLLPPVNPSKVVQELGYDPNVRELYVRFPSGKVYVYPDCSPEDHDLLRNAESPGKILNIWKSERKPRIHGEEPAP